jgi:hypothetical protein
MLRCLRTLFCATALLAALSAFAADRAWHPYREVCERLGLLKFYAVPPAQRDRLRLLFKVDPAQAGGQGLVLTINAAAQAIPVRPDAKGLLAFPYDEKLLAENPDVLINLPPGEKAAFELDLQPLPPTQGQLDYVRLMGGIPQANALIREQAGMLSLIAPKLRKLVLRYDHAQGQEVTVGEGAAAAHFRVDPHGEIVIAFDEALFARNVPVIISDRPASADFAE